MPDLIKGPYPEDFTLAWQELRRSTDLLVTAKDSLRAAHTRIQKIYQNAASEAEARGDTESLKYAQRCREEAQHHYARVLHYV